MDRFGDAVFYMTVLNPCTFAAIVAMWFAILGWAVNSELSGWPFFARVAERIPRWLVPGLSLGGAVATLIDRWVLFFGGVNLSFTLLAVVLVISQSTESWDALELWYHGGTRVWLALAVEGLILVLAYFALPLLLLALRIDRDHHERILMWVVSALLVVALMTVLVGLGRSIVMASLDAARLQGSLEVDYSLNPLLVALSPVALLLAVGLSAWCILSDKSRHVGVAGRIVIIVVIVVATGTAWQIVDHLPTL
jgi:hypothetical protein